MINEKTLGRIFEDVSEDWSALFVSGDRSVVGAGNGDGEVVLNGSTGVITHLIGDGDDLALALSQSVVGGVFGIKVPRAISSDGETADFCDGSSAINRSLHKAEDAITIFHYTCEGGGANPCDQVSFDRW